MAVPKGHPELPPFLGVLVNGVTGMAESKLNKLNDLSDVMRSAPPGEWVALSRDRSQIVGHGVTLEEALRLANEAGEDKPLILRSPEEHTGLAAAAN